MLKFKQAAKIVVVGLGTAFVSSTCAFAFDLLETLGLKEPVDPEDLVEISAEYNTFRCSDEYPILVNIHNGSDQQIQKTRFSVRAQKVNYSTITHIETYETDRIIKPSESYEACWSPLKNVASNYTKKEATSEPFYVLSTNIRNVLFSWD